MHSRDEHRQMIGGMIGADRIDDLNQKIETAAWAFWRLDMGLYLDLVWESLAHQDLDASQGGVTWRRMALGDVC